MVSGYEPAGVDAEVAMVSVELPPAEVTEVGLNVAVAPLGRPDAVSATVWAEPLVSVAATVVVSELPGLTAPDAGEAAREKSLPTGQAVSLPATLTEVQAAWTA